VLGNCEVDLNDLVALMHSGLKCVDSPGKLVNFKVQRRMAWDVHGGKKTAAYPLKRLKAVSGVAARRE
jgi:hypothetical protein